MPTEILSIDQRDVITCHFKPFKLSKVKWEIILTYNEFETSKSSWLMILCYVSLNMPQLTFSKPGGPAV